MKILFVSAAGDGAWFVWLLGKYEGHDVQWVCASEKDCDSLSGIIPKPLSKVPDPSSFDLVVFDTSSMGTAADEALFSAPVIGSSVLADQLEHDRIFGIEAMEAVGIKVPTWRAFSTPAEAIAWLNKEKKRCVLKPVGDAPADATYVSSDYEDMIHHIKHNMHSKVKSFVLQEFVAGTEVSTEAWWTGKEWVALNHTLEEKKFMAGGLGPNTGCAGNLVWMPDRHNPLFQQGLAKIAPLLQEYGYVGMVDLNTIVTEGDVYGLEWTPRFGYEGTCNLTRLLPMGFGDFLHAVATGQSPVLSQPRHRYAATIRLSVPPYPSAEFSRHHDNVPIHGVDCEHLESFVLYDVRKEGDGLVTGGHYQVIGCPIGCADSIDGAFDEVVACIKRLSIPNLQWRNDVCTCVSKRFNQLQSWGWLRNVG